ncbi:MAG: DUF2878 family protein [Deltaproteobacteria bacterium]|nr:MAG: DUF2878 family protein [Deltaproteobacteria bacterium]
MSQGVGVLIAKAIILQIYWFYAVSYGPKLPLMAVAIPCLILLALNYKVYTPKVSPGRYVLVIILFALYGLVQDYLFLKFGVLSYHQPGLPIWINTLFWIFVAYYGDIFNKLVTFSKIIQVIVGGLGGVMAYFGGARLGSITPGELPLFISGVFISWALFFPLSLWLWYESPLGEKK